MKLMIVLIACFMVGGVMTGCDSGDDSSSGYTVYEFVNNTGTDNCAITVWRDGGEEWEGGNDSFTLNNNGDEHSVTLRNSGTVGYRWTSACSDVNISTSGNQIIFRK